MYIVEPEPVFVTVFVETEDDRTETVVVAPGPAAGPLVGLLGAPGPPGPPTVTVVVTCAARLLA